MAVFVLDKRGEPLMPCSEKRARLLLERGRARVHRLKPFVIRLVDRLATDSAFQPLELKVDPGSKATGMAIVRSSVEDGRKTVHVRNLMEVAHRGAQIHEAMEQRKGFRRRRRANLRHRAPRFDNRTRKAGWLAPSLSHRVNATQSWGNRLCRWAPITGLAVERVKFDMQKMQNPEVSGVAYQQGELAGYQVREYLLEKWNRRCVYCDARDVPLEVEHIQAKSQGGSDRVSNLALSCTACNQKKGSLPIATFLARQPERLQRILKQARTSLRDAAAVNATRNRIVEMLIQTGLPLETGTGAQTKFNRRRLGMAKTHALDAVCVGEVGTVANASIPTLIIKCMGRGSYQRTRLDKYGFPRGYLTRKKRHFGFQTGDLVTADVPSGKKQGAYTGRVAVRESGRFNVQFPGGPVQGIAHRHCRLLQRADGYAYSHQPVDSPLDKEARTGSREAA